MLVKDFLVACTIVIAVMMVQFGVYNSCFCRSSFTDDVILIGYTDLQWLVAKNLWTGIPLTGLSVTGALILWVEKKGCESQKKRIGDGEKGESEAFELENLEGGNQDGLRD